MTAMKLRGIDLRHVSVSALGLSPERACAHTDSGGPELAAVLRHLHLSKETAVLDLGCGKGGALITFARLGFAHVDGVEISPELCAIARRNLALLGMNHARILEGDAAQFVDLDGYGAVYMYNPFPRSVVRAVVSNLAASLKRAPRPFILIYLNPTCSDAILTGPFEICRQLTLGQHTVHVYRFSPGPRMPAAQGIKP
jgi:SAM-dependent methyltransferase